MKPYTVLLLRPDYIAEPYGQDTYMAHVEAENPVNAIEAAQIEVWNEDHGDDAGESWTDYNVLLIIEGHHRDLYPVRLSPSPLPHAPKLLNAVQAAVAEHYEGGEFKGAPDVTNCGDGLFTFLIVEAGDASGPDEFMGMLGSAVLQLQCLETELLDYFTEQGALNG